MYQFPAWKYWLVILVMVAGLVFALPNFFGEEPALQVARQDRAAITAADEAAVLKTLEGAGIPASATYMQDDRLVVRLATGEQQLNARDALLKGEKQDYAVALSYASRMPAWLRDLGLQPMSLGLDLRGGVHFVYEVDVQDAIRQTLERLQRDFRLSLRDERIPFVNVEATANSVRVTLRDAADVARATKAFTSTDSTLVVTNETSATGPVLVITLTPAQIKERQDLALQQNLTTLRNRVDELGISEPMVARQGLDRIVVELPGVQDPNEAIRVLGATATLEFRLVDEAGDPYEAQRTGRAPLSAKLYKRRDNGAPILLKRDIIASGDQLTDATSGFSNGEPSVNVRLDARAGAQMLKTTQENLGKPMAVVYIERKRLGEGERCAGIREGQSCTQEEVISVATIRGVFSSSFQITGVQAAEARELALLLRAGSLATTQSMIEQRTVGPSLGADNIIKGVRALVIGLVLTFAFMAFYYRAFGWVANAVLLANLILTVGLLSMLQASLSLPGIAAVVFHLGIAVDANILIYERIREELRAGTSPQAAINAGFDKAFATIADSNVTTLIAGVVLFAFGTGTIRSFAIVMTLGIATSLFTSVVGSRALVHAIWGRHRRLERLSI
jgi:preprotein translocase subunit SecD